MLCAVTQFRGIPKNFFFTKYCIFGLYVKDPNFFILTAKFKYEKMSTFSQLKFSKFLKKLFKNFRILTYGVAANVLTTQKRNFFYCTNRFRDENKTHFYNKKNFASGSLTRSLPMTYIYVQIVENRCCVR